MGFLKCIPKCIRTENLNKKKLRSNQRFFKKKMRIKFFFDKLSEILNHQNMNQMRTSVNTILRGCIPLGGMSEISRVQIYRRTVRLAPQPAQRWIRTWARKIRRVFQIKNFPKPKKKKFLGTCEIGLLWFDSFIIFVLFDHKKYLHRIYIPNYYCNLNQNEILRKIYLRGIQGVLNHF